MAAGQGFKTFTTGEVLSAADVNGYLMQGVLVFASAAARDAAITSPQEGQFAYLKDTNITTYYTGSAWANVDSTGMTNPMTTTGDTIYSSSGSTPARLGIGSTGNVLTVAGGVPTWAAPAGGGATSYTLLNSGGTALSGVSTLTVSGLSGYNTLLVYLAPDVGITSADFFRIRINSDTSTKYSKSMFSLSNPASYDPGYITNTGETPDADTSINCGLSYTDWAGSIKIEGANSSGVKIVTGRLGQQGPGGTGGSANVLTGLYTGTSVVSSLTFFSSVNFTRGSVYIYGA